MFLCRIYVFRCIWVLIIRRKPFLGIRLSARCQPYAGSYPLWGNERNGSCPVLNAEMRCCKIKAVMAAGFHLFPFRTEKLSPPAPMVLRKWESRRPPTFQGSLRRRGSNSLFSFAEVLFNFTLQPSCYPNLGGSRNLVGIAIQLSDSEEEEFFVGYPMLISPEKFDFGIE